MKNVWLCVFLVLLTPVTTVFAEEQTKTALTVIEHIYTVQKNGTDICNPTKLPHNTFTEGMAEYYRNCRKAYTRIVKAIKEIESDYELILTEGDHLYFEMKEKTYITSVYNE